MTGSDASLARLRAAQAREGLERRRIERALHDGVQQDLIAVAVRLQLARQLAASDLTAVLALLDEIGRDIRDSLDRVRVLADRIYPSLLEAWGLPDALRGAASTVGVPARVEASGIGRYAMEIEAAVFFCGRAALENIAAHAGSGARATIRLTEATDTVLLEIADDGFGFDRVDHPAGDGLTSARDRIEALGGTLTVESEVDRGTRFAASVPLYDSSSAR